jgi:hypothetical protein
MHERDLASEDAATDAHAAAATGPSSPVRFSFFITQ